MIQPDPHETTQLLRDWAGGDQAALDRLAPRVYKELRRIAAGLMKLEQGGRTLVPTALVHEAYLRMIDADRVTFQHRAHFLSVAAKMMRQILLDQARRRHALKRGGHAAKVNLDVIAELVPDGTARAMDDRMLIALDDALKELAQVDERRAMVVEMRYFGGLTVEETAGALSISTDTVKRDWRVARAWLAGQINAAVDHNR
jgi:RNA polymerase sigma factor (TIGR02999 family)